MTTDEAKKMVDDHRCPLCKKQLEFSSYLSKVFKGDMYYLACLITHYRHEHSKWDKVWTDIHSRKVYAGRKQIVNNEVKKYMIITQHEFLKTAGITADHFKQLQTHNADIEQLCKTYL